MSHILYSRGRLLAGVSKPAAVEQLSVITKKESDRVEEKLLSGKRKRIKSSDTLGPLVRLKSKFQDAGLDVYIDSGDPIPGDTSYMEQ